MTRISRFPARAFRALAAAGLTWVGAACGSGDGGSSSASVRDSAGIRIVELAAPPEGPGRWSIAAQPVLESGWGDGDPQFQTIGSGAIAPGRVIVADPRSNAVTVLPLDGGPVRMLGGPGEGPGEFGRVGNVVVLDADSLLVSDSGNLRVTWYIGDEYAFDRRFESNVGAAMYEPISRSENGSFILTPSAFAVFRNMAPGWKEYPILATRDFASLDTLATLPLTNFGSPDSRNMVTHHGSVFAAGGGFAHARTDRPEVTWRDPTGTVTQIARWDEEPREATEEDWADWERTYRSRSSPGGDPEAYEQRIRDLHDDFGGPVPLFGSGYGDDEGNVWLAEQTFAGIPDTYLILSRDGEWIGRVGFPRPILILDIADDLVLGSVRNDLDVQAVAVYRIDRGGG